MKGKTEGNVIIEGDKNTMKCRREIKQRAIRFVVENSIAPLLGFRNVLHEVGKYTSLEIFDIMGFNTFNIHC